MTPLERRRLVRGYSAIPSETANRDGENKTMANLSKKQGKTRGKNPREIEYDVFDISKPETLPKTLKEFADVTGTKTEPEMVDYVIAGFNAEQYAAASDEIGEYIDDRWDKDTQNQFRLAVRNYSKLTGQDIEAAVNLIKPGVEKAFAAKQATPQAVPA